MTKQRTLRNSKRFYIVSTTLGWAIPMSIFACAVFWKLGVLTIGSALALIGMALVTGLGSAAVIL